MSNILFEERNLQFCQYRIINSFLYPINISTIVCIRIVTSEVHINCIENILSQLVIKVGLEFLMSFKRLFLRKQFLGL